MNIEVKRQQSGYLAQKFANSTILVSGATGLIGSRVVKYLCEINDMYVSNIKIIALYKNKLKKNKVFLNFLDRSDIFFVEGDINSSLAIDCNVDYVIHCAGISGGSKMHLKNPMLVFETAYNGTKNLLDFSSTHGVSAFCFVSTYEIYGNISQEELITENERCILDTMVLRNIYAETKRMCESMCVASASTCNMKVCVGRLTSTFGSGVDYNDPRFFAEFARCVIDNNDIVLKSSGGTVRSYLDADDAASAFLYILANGENNTAYNITNMDNNISIKDIGKKVIDLSGANSELRFEIAEDVSKMGYRLEGTTLMDASKLYGLGWKPVFTLGDTLLKLIEDFKKQRETIGNKYETNND